MNKKNKSVIMYFVILGLVGLFCHGFLGTHYSSDTYVLYDLGYMDYPSEYFLLDGRLISAAVCYAAGLMGIPINIYLIIMNFIGVIFMATAIYIFSKTVFKIMDKQNIVFKIMIILATFVFLLNQFSLEYQLFPESGIMCLGFLLVTIAATLTMKNTKFKYIKIFVLLMLAVFCYQGVLNVFSCMIIVLYIIKNIVEKKHWKEQTKTFFEEMLKFAIIVISVLTISIVVIGVSKILLGSDQDRMIKMINFEAFILRAEIVFEYIDELWLGNMEMLPKYINLFVLGITSIMLIVLKTKKEIVLKYILFLGVSFVICIVPMFIYNTGPCGRVNNPLMMMWGGSLLILLVQSSIQNSELKKRIVFFIIIISFLINNIYILKNIDEHLKSNEVDHYIGSVMKQKLDEYEVTTGVEVTKFEYIYDLRPNQYATGIKEMGSMTERKFACSWSIRHAANYYCERKFEKIDNIFEIDLEKYYQLDYNTFDESQIVFENDAMYLIVY